MPSLVTSTTSPSTSPSVVRTSSSSNKPSITSAAMFQWQIGLKRNSTMNGDNMLEVNYNISNQYYDLSIFESDCITTVVDALGKTDTFTGVVDGFKDVDA